MDNNQIKNIVNSLSKLIDGNEKVSLTAFAGKLAAATEAHPGDYTIGMMANITSRMADNKLFITRAEIKDLYNKLFSRNSKFAEIFQDELGIVDQPVVATKYNRDGNDEDYSVINKAYEQIVDPTLANALNSAFGNNKVAFTQTNAENAKIATAKQFMSFATEIDAISGNENFIICRASFETPKGQTSFFVPVEIYAGKALLPSVFVGNSGPEEISKATVQKYLQINAGKKLNVSDKNVLAALNEKDEEISNVDLALIKLNSSKESLASYSANSVLFQNVEKENKNFEVKIPEYKDSEIESFAKSFDSPAGIASFSFGKDKVKIARDLIANKLNSFGLNNYQIAVYSSDKTSVVYAVSLNNGRNAFRVPVKIENGKILSPEILLSNGSIQDFSKNSFSSILKNASTDFKISAAASPLFDLKSSDLIEIVRSSMNEKNYNKAEEALNVLASGTDTKAYQTAFAAYTSNLNPVKVAATKCSMIVKNASSTHELCGHTGLPLHKVSQDKDGNCVPQYRKEMSETNDVSSSINSKIFF